MMKHIVVDLEMNSIPKESEERMFCSREVVEIGVVMLDGYREISSLKNICKTGV